MQTDASGDLVDSRRADEHLQYQPLSALVTCNAGERVLLRFANLGFKESAMTLAGIKMRVVGKDATPMKGRDGTDTSYEASTVSFGAGESIDAIFTAPASAADRQSGWLRHLRPLRPRLRALEQPGPRAASLRRPADRGARLRGRHPAAAVAPEHLAPYPHDPRGETHHASIIFQPNPARQGLRLGLALLTAGLAPLAAAGGRASRAAADRRRVHDERQPEPDVHAGHQGRLHPAPGRQHDVHVGVLRRAAAPSSTRARCCASTRATPSR